MIKVQKFAALTLLLAVSMPFALAPNGLAQQAKKPIKRSATETERVGQLKAPPEMPGISFPNGKFLGGFRNQEAGGTSMGARFHVNDSSSSVIAYYRGALKSGGWTLNEQASRDNRIYASNIQAKSSVTIQTLRGAGSGCDVYFTYGMK